MARYCHLWIVYPAPCSELEVVQEPLSGEIPADPYIADRACAVRITSVCKKRAGDAFFVFLCMAGSMISGILLSRYVFRLDIHSFSAVLQTVHMLSAYWGFVFLSLHLGLHWRGMMGMAGKFAKKPSEFRKWALRGIAVLIAGYGAYAFIKRDFGNYMLLRYHFVFFDFEESQALFLLDYAAIMGLFVCVGYYLAALLQKSRTRR